MSDGKLTYKEKSSIKFIDQADPPFIQKIKERLGYKPPPTIESKFSTTTDEGYIENDLEEDDWSRIKEEDRPQVVVLNTNSDLSEKEVEAELAKKRDEEDRRKIEEGRIVFKKPMKRNEEKLVEEPSGKRKLAGEGREKLAAPNARLLSFNDTEEEDG